MTPPGARHWFFGLGVVIAGCGSAGSTTAPTPTTAATPPPGARAAVSRWLGHLTAHDDAAAFADLAPRSQHGVGDVDNYRRGSERFGGVYANFARADAELVVLPVTGALAVVTLHRPVEGATAPAAVAVPVRRVRGRWRVDPILDVGSYTLRPDDGAIVGASTAVSAQLDDPSVRVRVWFDARPSRASSARSFRPRAPLSPGWHLATVMLLRGDDVVARVLALRVAPS